MGYIATWSQLKFGKCLEELGITSQDDVAESGEKIQITNQSFM